MITVTKLFEFEAAHYLPNYNGKCKNMHGHTFKLEVEITSSEEVDLPNGMIMDFSTLKNIVHNEVIVYLDHTILNEMLSVPTSENLVIWIHERLTDPIESFGCILTRIRLYETSKSYAEWTNKIIID